MNGPSNSYIIIDDLYIVCRCDVVLRALSGELQGREDMQNNDNKYFFIERGTPQDRVFQVLAEEGEEREGGAV